MSVMPHRRHKYTLAVWWPSPSAFDEYSDYEFRVKGKSFIVVVVAPNNDVPTLRGPFGHGRRIDDNVLRCASLA